MRLGKNHWPVNHRVRPQSRNQNQKPVAGFSRPKRSFFGGCHGTRLPDNQERRGWTPRVGVSFPRYVAIRPPSDTFTCSPRAYQFAWQWHLTHPSAPHEAMTQNPTPPP
ncbi:hypothetical protein U1Q18_012126 [Sarracenia purpurea var. burkii]